jgi:hypothetical protein
MKPNMKLRQKFGSAIAYHKIAINIYINEMISILANKYNFEEWCLLGCYAV